MKASKKSRAPFALTRPSAKRMGFLDHWLKERALALALRKNSAATPGSSPALKAAGTALAPKDWHIEAGDIRLLGKECLDVPGRPIVYLAVLAIYKEEGMALVAPFSPYAAPATAGEWQTPYASEPLRVLELWNARTVPLFRLAHSWRCKNMRQAELKTTQTLLRHTISGAVMPAGLREQTGLPIYIENDPRLAYQEEEIRLLAPLTASAMAVLEAAPAAETAASAWLHTHPPALALAAGTARENRAEVAWLDRNGKRKWIGTARMEACTPAGKGWQVDWQIEHPPADLPPGLPVYLCVKYARSWQIMASTVISRNKRHECWVVARLAEPAGTAGQDIAKGAPVRIVIVTPKDT